MSLPLRRQQNQAVVQRPHPLPEIEQDNPLQEAANNYNTMKGQLAMVSARNRDLEAQIAQMIAERDFYKQQHEDAVGALDRHIKYASSLETRLATAANTMLDGIRESKEFALKSSVPSRSAPEEQPGDDKQSTDVPQFLKLREAMAFAGE